MVQYGIHGCSQVDGFLYKWKVLPTQFPRTWQVVAPFRIFAYSVGFYYY